MMPEEATQMVPTLNAVDLPSGVRLPYFEQGERRGTPVIFLHGYPDSWFAVTTMLPYLPLSLRVIAPTQRGWGDAGRPEQGYTMDDYAGDVVAFMDALGVEQAVVVGHSMGSLIAQKVAIRQPERVQALMLIGSVSTFRDHPDLLELTEYLSTVDDPLDPEFVHEFQRGMFVHEPAPGLVESLIDESLKGPAKTWKAALKGIMAFDSSAELSRIAAPTVLVWGDQDTLCSRAEQEILLAGIPNSRLSVYRGEGHVVNWEKPEAVAAELVDLVSRV
jgi:pimeloyl-ACP methyl ester carboxylesterase